MSTMKYQARAFAIRLLRAGQAGKRDINTEEALHRKVQDLAEYDANRPAMSNQQAVSAPVYFQKIFPGGGDAFFEFTVRFATGSGNACRIIPETAYLLAFFIVKFSQQLSLPISKADFAKPSVFCKLQIELFGNFSGEGGTALQWRTGEVVPWRRTIQHVSHLLPTGITQGIIPLSPQPQTALNFSMTK